MSVLYSYTYGEPVIGTVQTAKACLRPTRMYRRRESRCASFKNTEVKDDDQLSTGYLVVVVAVVATHVETAVAGVRSSTAFVCLFFSHDISKTGAARIIKLDIDGFYIESWKPSQGHESREFALL